MKKLFVLKLFFLFSLMSIFNINAKTRTDINNWEKSFIAAYYFSALIFGGFSKNFAIKCFAVTSIIGGLISDGLYFGADMPCMEGNKSLNMYKELFGVYSLLCYLFVFEKYFFDKLKII